MTLYLPRGFEMAPEEVRRLAREVGSLELITVDGDGLPQASRVPFVWEGDVVRVHLAWANPHWRTISDGALALAIVTGPEAYVSPGFYATKAEHGRVVPTWNYSALHLRGTVRVVRDAGWLRTMVSDLTDQHEAAEAAPWSVADAPDSYLDQQLRAIVGVELTVVSVEAKAKRSQNRSEADRVGTEAGLRARGTGRDAAMAAQMERDRLS